MEDSLHLEASDEYEVSKESLEFLDWVDEADKTVERSESGPFASGPTTAHPRMERPASPLPPIQQVLQDWVEPEPGHWDPVGKSKSLHREGLETVLPKPAELYPHKLICNYCNQECKTKPELAKHLQRHIRPFLCSVPGCTRGEEGFSTRYDLDRHQRSRHPRPVSGSQRYRCTLGICIQKDKIWPRRDNFRQHLKRVHKRDIDPEDELKEFIVPQQDPGDPAVDWTSNIRPDNLQQQTSEQLFPLTPAQYGGITSQDILHDAPERSATSQGRRNLAAALASMRSNSKAEVYTPSLLWDQIPSDVAASSKETHMVEPHKQDAAANRHVASPTLSLPLQFDVFTDSGYGSHGGGKNSKDNLRRAEEFGAEVSELQPELAPEMLKYDDRPKYAETTYSDTMSLRDLKLDEYVVAFADELSHALPGHISRNDLENCWESLPSLLEAFASRIGYENPERIQLQVKYLVHRNRLQIIELLRRRLCQEANDDGSEGGNDPESWRSNDPGMEVHDKIHKWLSESADLDHPSAFDDQSHETDNFEDIEDEDLPELSVYQLALTQSSAYRWLLSSLQRERDLAIPGGLDTRNAIRNQIIREFPRPSSFSRQDYREVRMHFRVDWDPARFYEEQGYDQPIEHVLAHALAITGYGNNVQSVTCLEYMSQTWPETGAALLSLIQQGVNRKGDHVWHGTLPGRTRVSCRLESGDTPYLLVVALGNLFSVAEVGEQLAWLGAALRSSPFDNVSVYCHPNIEYLRAGHQLVPKSHGRASQESINVCVFGYEFKSVDVNSDSPGSCWYGLFRTPVIVAGYPVPRRLTADTGLQVSVQIASALLNAKRIVQFAGTTFLKGFSAMLAATKVTEDTVFWHLAYNSDGSYISYEDSRIPRWDEKSDVPTMNDVVGRKHHIVGWCDQVLNYAGAPDASYSIGWSGLPGPSQSCAFEKVTISGGQFINAGVSCVLGLKDKPLHINYGDDYLGMLLNISERHFVLYDRDDRRSWLVDGASTLLHLLRASIEHYKNDIRLHQLLFADKIKFEEAGTSHTGSRGAFEVLSNLDNQIIPLYHKKTEAWNEKTTQMGAPSDQATREKTTYFCVRDRIEQLCHCLCQITAHQDDVQTQAGVGFRLRLTPRRQLEGFDFMDIATGHGTLWPKVATLAARGQGWVDFARAIHAPTLFGSGFGDLFVPSAASGPSRNTKTTCGHCSWNSLLPKGKDYLAACVVDLKDIVRKKGSMTVQPWRLVDDIHWSTPDVAFEPCTGQSVCISKKVDRVQVLLPSSFPKLWKRRSPTKLAVNGAVIFGHSSRFPLRWRGLKDPPEQGEPEVVEEVEELLHDSGLGTSIDSQSSGEDLLTRKSSSPSSQSGGRPDTNSDSFVSASKSKQGDARSFYNMENSQLVYDGSHNFKRHMDDDCEEGDVKKAKHDMT